MEKPFKFSLKDGKNLSYRVFNSKTNAIKVLVVHHGLSEHSGRYKVLTDYLDPRIKIYALDAKGHGNSDGRRAYISKFENYVDDLEEFISFVKSEETNKDICLLGHSMGSLVVVSYAKRACSACIKSLVISGFAGDVALNTFDFKIKKMIAPILSFFLPRLFLPNNDGFNNLTHDKKMIEEFMTDPLRNKIITARLGNEILKAAENSYRDLKKISLPVYILHGKEDKITSYKGSQKLFDKISSIDKKLKIYEGLYHETFNETLKDRKKVIEDLNVWLLEH